MYRLYAIDRKSMQRVWEGTLKPARQYSKLILQARHRNDYLSSGLSGRWVYEVERVEPNHAHVPTGVTNVVTYVSPDWNV